MHCFFWNHNWEKWEVSVAGDLRILQRVVGVMYIQKRICKKCGLTELKKEEIII